MNLSVVIPLYDEAPSLERLFKELSEVAIQEGYQLEVIFVDDGSSDDSWQVIQRLSEQSESVGGIRLRRNFGKATALSIGAADASYETIITLDADLQDDPREIPKLLAKQREGYDVVSGWKQARQDPWTRRVASRVFNSLINTLTKVKLHDHNCGFKSYRREVFDEIELYGGRHRFIPVLAASRGFRIGEVPVQHRARVHGKSKYGVTRLLKGFLDLLTVCFLTGFSQRPQYLLGSAGLLSFGVGLIGLGYMAVYWVIRETMHSEWTPVHQRPVVLYCVAALLLGIQLLIGGFLAELIVDRDQRKHRRFGIRQRIERRPKLPRPTARPAIASPSPQPASKEAD